MKETAKTNAMMETYAQFNDICRSPKLTFLVKLVDGFTGFILIFSLAAVIFLLSL